MTQQSPPSGPPNPELDELIQAAYKPVDSELPCRVPPPPTFELKIEQHITISKMEHMFHQVSKDELVKMVVALQTQNFALSNNITNLCQAWERNFQAVESAQRTTSVGPSKPGTSSEIRG